MKVAAVAEVFTRCLGPVEVVPISADSDVPRQPIGDETFAGAENRAHRLARLNAERELGAQFFVGIEGGVTQTHGRWFGFGVVFIMDRGGRSAVGITSHFELPAGVTARLLQGAELGDLIDGLSGQENTREGSGAVGFFTRGQLDRKGLTEQGVVMALAPFLNQSLFFAGDADDGAPAEISGSEAQTE